MVASVTTPSDSPDSRRVSYGLRQRGAVWRSVNRSCKLEQREFSAYLLFRDTKITCRVINYCASLGLDVNWRSPQGDTPLIAACRNGHSPTALCLLDHNAEVNAKAGDGQTALHFSCRRGNEAVAEALILRGADVFAKNNEGATAFESIGPHVPAGMFRRLNVVAQRQRGDQNHVESGPTASALRRHPADSSAGTRRHLSGRANEQGIKECRARRRHERNQGHTAHTHDETREIIGERLLLPPRGRDGGAGEGGNRTAAGRGGNGPTDDRSVIFSRDDVNDDREEAHLGDRTMGSTMGDGGEESPDHQRARNDNHGRSNRTTFPSIASASAMANTLQRSASAAQSESSIPPPSDRNISTPGTRVGEGLDAMDGHNGVQRRVVSRGDPTSGSGEIGSIERLSLNATAGRRDGWAGDSSDDEDINSDLGQRRTSIRLLDGIHRGPTIRQGRSSIGDTSLPESMRLLSTVNSISHAQSVMSPAATSPASTSLSDDSTISDSVIHPGGHIFYSSSLWNDPDDEGNDNIREGIDAGEPAAATSLAPTTNAPTIAAYSTDASGSSTSPAGRRRTVASGGVEMPAGALEEADAPYAGSSGMRASGCLQSKPGPMPNDHAASDTLKSSALRTRVQYPSTLQVGLIRMLWVQEKESRMAAEAEADAVRFQSTRLWNELVRSEKQVLGLEESLATTREERDMLRATLRGEEVEGRSLQDLETLEKDLRRSLDGVCKERDRILKEQITKDEQRLCVVCQENERGVLLLPCRHLCVCKSCSERPELLSCPLCRDEIVERLVVYS